MRNVANNMYVNLDFNCKLFNKINWGKFATLFQRCEQNFTFWHFLRWNISAIPLASYTSSFSLVLTAGLFGSLSNQYVCSKAYLLKIEYFFNKFPSLMIIDNWFCCCLGTLVHVHMYVLYIYGVWCIVFDLMGHTVQKKKHGKLNNQPFHAA